MPILAVDQFGKIYETSPDRADGLGYKGHAPTVSQGDVTLGSAYIKANRDYGLGNVRDARNRQIEDDFEKRERRQARQEQAALHAKQADDQALLENELYQRSLLRRAIQMGCSSDYTTQMSGNVMTANGRSGWHGMDQTQKVVNRHLAPMGEQVAFRPDPVEVEQARQRARADQVISNQARLDARRNQLEVKQGRVNRGKAPVMIYHPLQY
jgi:hypothetical protein